MFMSGSMLHAMFSGRFDAKPSGDGSYFIDRDGTHFRHILNYLRTGQLIVPQDEIIRVELLAEADFYQIEGIVNPLRGSFFKDSVILSLEQRQTLVTWLKEIGPITISSEKLLYCASRDGWHAPKFHSCCGNQGPTVTVIKSGNYIFGGYTEKSWNGCGVYKRAPDSFLFSLVNPSGLPPTKMPLTAGTEGNAIYCDSSSGPVFGESHDLIISSEPNSYSSLVNLGNSYQCPTGQNAKTFLTGDQYFTVSEMEVFGFGK